MNPRLPDLSTLFPWHAWLHHRALRSPACWVFVALVAVPPLAFTMLPDTGEDVTAATTTFAVYFAVSWFLVLRAVVRPQAIDRAVLGVVAAVALLVEVPVAIAMEEALDSGTEHVATSILTVGVPEELAKMVPVVALVLWCRHRGRPLPPREVLFVGAVSGLGFGAAEAVRWVTEYMPALLTTSGALVVVWRLLADPIVHACWAGVAGYFLGLASYYRAVRPWLVLAGVGIGVTAVLHGLHDVVGGGPAWIAVTAVSALLFLAYARVGISARPTTTDQQHRAVPHRAVPHPSAAPDPVTAPLALGRHHARGDASDPLATTSVPR